MSDLIDRQAAIDAVENIDCSDGVGISTLKCEAVDDVVTAIKALPSAQSEIIRCKDCKHFRTYYHGTGSDPVITHACVWFLDRAMGLEDYCSKGVFR